MRNATQSPRSMTAAANASWDSETGNVTSPPRSAERRRRSRARRLPQAGRRPRAPGARPSAPSEELRDGSEESPEGHEWDREEREGERHQIIHFPSSSRANSAGSSD